MSTSITLRLKVLGGGLVVALALYLTNYLVTPAIVGEELEIVFRPHLNMAFDSTTWKRADPRAPLTELTLFYGKRYEMVDSLLRSKLLLDTNEQRVRELLGDPESTSEGRGTKSLYYFLADQRQYPARSIWFPGLFSNLDRWMFEVLLRDGRVVAARVYFT
jgi:hypothetical protein